MTPLRRRVGITLSTLALPIAVAWPALARGEPFTPGCTLPFATIAETHTLDSSCPVEGQGSATSQLQNRAKNNFCATGTPVTLTYQNFKSLQTAVKSDGTIRFGCPTCLPDDRSKLRDIFTLPNGTRVGEGSLVRYVGFIAHPRYSNTSGGEAVNCKKNGQANNDIHVYPVTKHRSNRLGTEVPVSPLWQDLYSLGLRCHRGITASTTSGAARGAGERQDDVLVAADLGHALLPARLRHVGLGQVRRRYLA